jgi:hypothetical protein
MGGQKSHHQAVYHADCHCLETYKPLSNCVYQCFASWSKLGALEYAWRTFRSQYVDEHVHRMVAYFQNLYIIDTTTVKTSEVLTVWEGTQLTKAAGDQDVSNN